MAQISIESFDPNQQTPPYLTSPRSLEACKRRGIDPSELVFRSEEYFAKGKVTKTDKEIARQRFQHHEERRQAKITEVREERVRILEEEKAGNINFVSTRHNVSVKQDSVSGLSSGLIEREKRELEKMQRKQAQEIQQMVEYEKELSSIRMRNEEKEAIMRKKEAERQEELKKKQVEYEAFKLKDELRRKKLKEDDEARVKAMALEEESKARKREQEEEAKEQKRMQEARDRERDRQRRAEELKANTQKIFDEQQRRFTERKQKMEEREQKRIEMMEMHKNELREQSERSKEAKQKKLEAARLNIANMNEEQRKRFEERQRISEEKRIALEKERQKNIEKLHKRGLEKEEQIARVCELNKKKEEDRYRLYQDSVAKAEQLQGEIQKEKDKELKVKLEREHEKQEHIAQVRKKMQDIESDRVSKIMEKQVVKEVAIEKGREKQLHDESLRRNQIEMKRKDRFDAVTKLSRMQEYQKLKVLTKIQSDAERADETLRQKEMLCEQRRKLRESITRKKMEILEKFETIKKKNHSGEELQKALDSLVPPQGETSAMEKRSVSKSPEPPADLQKQIFTTSGPPVDNGPVVAVEIKPSIQRSTLPPEARGKKVTEEMKRQKVSALEKKLKEELRQRALAERDTESARLEKLNSVMDTLQRERLEGQFEVDRARVIQQLRETEEANKRKVQMLADKLGVKWG